MKTSSFEKLLKKTKIIKAVWYRCKDRYIDQQNKTENPEINNVSIIHWVPLIKVTLGKEQLIIFKTNYA